MNQYVVALRTQVAPLSQDFMTQFSQQAEQLKTRLQSDMAAATGTLQPYTEQLVMQLDGKVEELRKEVGPYAEAMDPEALKAVVLQKSQELKVQLEKSVGELQAQMVPFTNEMKDKIELSLDEFQKSVTPLAQSFQTQLTQKSQEIQQNLVPLGEELRAKLDAGAQDVQAQLAALWTSFTRKTQ